ncbi:hypothetical protein CEXT_376821 [Caerostris extrusa]|uniref:Uncharacterized protein n=1 Tax=Caerostris extrusa TaxID=172846 RepID=A0AAV4MMH8_CAEEX|nr:hypothetical protein CEXT_376821 [Caerostris extrusa]
MWSGESTLQRINEQICSTEEIVHETISTIGKKKKKKKKVLIPSHCGPPLLKIGMSSDQATVAMETPFQVTRRKRNQGKRAAIASSLTPNGRKSTQCCLLLRLSTRRYIEARADAAFFSAAAVECSK